MSFEEIFEICKDEMAKLLGVKKEEVSNNPWWDCMSTFANLNAGDEEITEDDLRQDFRELVEDVIDQKKGE